jgi:hypothetical protein
VTKAEVKIEKLRLSPNFTEHLFKVFIDRWESPLESINPLQLDTFEIERSAQAENLKNGPGVVFSV